MSSPRVLILVAFAILVAVVALERRDDSADGEPQASQGQVVRASNPVGIEDGTPSVPKPSWPLPETSASAGSSAEPSETAAPSQPCDLVSRSEAASILEEAVSVSAGLQGPSCIYASRDSAQQVAVVVENASPSNLRNRPDKASRIEVGGRTGWCLRYGSGSVEVPLSDGRVLDVSGPCAPAARFAALALDRVES